MVFSPLYCLWRVQSEFQCTSKSEHCYGYLFKQTLHHYADCWRYNSMSFTFLMVSWCKIYIFTRQSLQHNNFDYISIINKAIRKMSHFRVLCFSNSLFAFFSMRPNPRDRPRPEQLMVRVLVALLMQKVRTVHVCTWSIIIFFVFL